MWKGTCQVYRKGVCVGKGAFMVCKTFQICWTGVWAELVGFCKCLLSLPQTNAGVGKGAFQVMEEVYVWARALQALLGQGLNRGLGPDCLCGSRLHQNAFVGLPQRSLREQERALFR